MAEAELGPAALVLAEATRRNAALGHENLGPLSESHGFLSQRAPEHDLPAPYDAWVAAVDELPDLCSTLRIRRRLNELPLLDASAEALDDRHLLRAASVLGLLAHAYNNVPMRAPETIPDTLVRPWLQTAERLGRPPFTLSNTDYIFDNWRVADPDARDPMRVENLRLLNRIWDHPGMDTFILVLVELLARSAPLVGSAVRAQEACRRRDDEGLKAELVLMSETIRRLTRESLPKISPNARSGPRRVDPVLWTKLFAMIPLPVQGAPDGVRNASGAETPYFHLMDVVLGRRHYETQLGHEAMQFRHAHPPHWRSFIAAVGKEPVADYLRTRADPELHGLFAELAETYQGGHGLLAAHRLKAFAYMEASFKTGRSSTVTGFTGLFEDRAWETVDASFDEARRERERSVPPARRLARVESVEDLCPGVRRVALDVRGLGLHCDPGDRCGGYWISSVAPARIELTVDHLFDAQPGSEIPVSVVPSAGLSLPRDASVPIVMLGEGIGVAPFVGFLEARAGTPGSQNLLFAAADTAEALPHRELLLRYAEDGDADVHFVFTGNQANPRRVDHLLRAPVWAARLRDLIGAGARIYVCGSAGFARSVMDAVAEALPDPLSDLIVQHRYRQQVLPAHTPSAPAREIDASELARHRNTEDGVWAAIAGRVYDLTAFAEFHPGGQKLIQSFAGMDATSSYRIVEHHRDPLVEALLSMFEIGVMRRPSLAHPALETLFRDWVRSLNVLVEIQNAHRLDTSIEVEPLRRGERPGALPPTPYRLQFAVEAHGRFLGQTVPIVCRRFGELWQTTSAACSEPGDGRALDDELGRILAGPAADGARECCQELEGRLEREGAATELHACLTDLHAGNAAYLDAAKKLVASGVRAFERHEGGVLTEGREALVDALRGLPALTHGHLEALAARNPATCRSFA